MTRRSRREIEDALDDLRDRVTTEGDRPDSLTEDEKQFLNELFDVDPWDENPEMKAAVRDLHRQEMTD